MKKLVSPLILLSMVFSNTLPIRSQAERTLPLKKTSAFVLEFRAPYNTILVDIDNTIFLDVDFLPIPISAATKLVNRKGKPLDRSMIRPGMELEITGERFFDRVEISEIRLKTDHEKWDAEAKGYFEALDGDKAWIDGRAVRLNTNSVIVGKGAWKNKTFRSFSELSLGAAVKVEGVRRADGIIYANKVEAEPNEFTGGDQRMLNLVKAGTFIPTKLEGGKGIVGGKEVKFVDDLELQTYINKIGNRLVPRYERDLPNDYPGKKVYRFAVIEDESFNAFALPDGSVFINTGLLKQIKNEAQLAAVIGHEIAHATHEHGRKRLEGQEKRQWLSIAAVLGGAMVGSQELAAAGVLAVGALQNHYARREEDQADRVGLRYMVRAGYDPREAAKVWREISNNAKRDVIGNFLYSSHPLARTRLKNINREIAFSHYDSDFSHLKIGVDEYTRIVGGYFGWVERVAPSPAGVPPGSIPLAGNQSPSSTRKAPVRRKVVNAPHIKAPHRNTLGSWLIALPGWRPALTSDAYVGVTGSARVWLRGEIRGMGHHPYYVSRDFNRDGIEDFALMLVKGAGKARKFAFAVFNGTSNGFAATPTYFTEEVGTGDFIFWKTGDSFGDRFIIGSPASDSGFLVVPQGGTYREG